MTKNRHSYTLLILTVLSSFLFLECGRLDISNNQNDILFHKNRKNLSSVFQKYSKSTSAADRFYFAIATGSSRDTLLTCKLKRLLNDSSPLVRLGAAFALGRLECDSSKVILLRRFQTETDFGVKKQILISLGDVEDEKTLFNSLKYYTDDELVEPLLQEILRFHHRKISIPASRRFATTHLVDKNYLNRRLSANIFARVDSAHLDFYMQDLSTAARCNDPIVRALTARTIANSHRTETEIDMATVSSLTNDAHSEVRTEMAKAFKYFTDSEALWYTTLNDENPNVVVTALNNAPVNINPGSLQKDHIYNLLKSKSREVRGAAVRFIISHFGPAALDSLKLNDLLLYKVYGLSYWGKENAIDILHGISKSRKKLLSTSAYEALLNITSELVRNGNIKPEIFTGFLEEGLKSKDLAKISLAVTFIDKSYVASSDLLPVIYNLLQEIRYVKYTESIIDILKILEKLKPPDALEHLEDLLSFPNLTVRKKSAALIRLLYGKEYEVNILNLPKTPDLSKLHQYGLRPEVTLETTKGRIVIRCDAYYAPFTVASFLNLVDKGFYNGLTFHRVIPNFVIQGGDPRGDGWGGPDFTLMTESSPISYSKGAVGMANAGFDTEGSQFFITKFPLPHLNSRYTLFGNVIHGMDAVMQIEKEDRIFRARVTGKSE